MKKKDLYDLLYNRLLDQIKIQLDSIDEWLENGSIQLAGRAETKADFLISQLEIFNCGVAGGFDEGQPEKDSKSLVRRYKWLKKHRREM